MAFKNWEIISLSFWLVKCKAIKRKHGFQTTSHWCNPNSAKRMVPVLSLLFLRAPNSVYVYHKIFCLLTCFGSIFMWSRNRERHVDMALPRTLPLTSFSKVSGRTACLRTRILPAPLFCKRVVVRDVIFHFFLCEAEQNVARKPEGKNFLFKWWGRSGEPKQDFSEERLPK